MSKVIKDLMRIKVQELSANYPEITVFPKLHTLGIKKKRFTRRVIIQRWNQFENYPAVIHHIFY